MTILRVDSGRQNSFSVSSLTSEHVQAENMSMSQNQVQPGAPQGSLNSLASRLFMYKYIGAQLSYDRQNIIVLSAYFFL